MKHTIHLLLALCLFFSCTTNKKLKDEDAVYYTVNKDSSDYKNGDIVSSEAYDPWDCREKSVNIDSLKKYLEKEKQMREDLLAELKNTTPDRADSLYTADSYKFYKTADFQQIDRIAMPTLMRSSGAHLDYPISPEDKIVIQLLKEHGLEPQYIGEGYTELNTNPYYYYEIFKPYITEETSEYISIRAGQDDLISMDAGLVIPLETLYDRCVEWEVFLNKYPETNHKKSIIQQYGFYMGLIMFCSYDNTLAFDRKTHKLNDWVLEDIQKIALKNTDTQTNHILKEYIKELENNNYLYSKDIENRIMSLSILKEFDPQGVYY